VLRGFVHVHTNLSYDGAAPLEQVVATLRARGADFIAITEHNDGLDERAVAELEHRCAASSRDGVIVLPGVELRCENNLHLLSVGRAFAAPVGLSLEEAIDRVQRQGGLAVLAHPPRQARSAISPAALDRCNGIEVWNGKRDARWFIPSGDCAWVQALHLPAGPWAFAGVDLHTLDEAHGVTLRVRTTDRAAEAILLALRRGAFELGLGPLRYDSLGQPSAVTGVASTAIERVLYPAWAGWRNGTRRWQHAVRSLLGRAPRTTASETPLASLDRGRKASTR
jgi:hypothetical protein